MSRLHLFVKWTASRSDQLRPSVRSSNLRGDANHFLQPSGESDRLMVGGYDVHTDADGESLTSAWPCARFASPRRSRSSPSCRSRLGIGAATSVYALTFALFFAPPAGVDRPESLVRICRLVNGRPEGHELSYAEYVYYRDHATVFTELASDGNVKMLTDTESGDQLLAAVVSPSYFTVLGLRPRAGRFFLPGEDTAAGHHQVVVLSHGFWQTAVRRRRSPHRRTPHARWDVLRDRGRRASELRRLERRLGARHLRAHPCGLQRGRPRKRKERTTGRHRPARAWSHARRGAGRDDGPGPPAGAGGAGRASRRQPASSRS